MFFQNIKPSEIIDSCPLKTNKWHTYVISFHFNFSFLQDSLDLSHDDIHRSLQANMAANRPNGHAVDLNPMEFIEQNGGGTSSATAGGGGGGTGGGAASSASAAAAAAAAAAASAANNGTANHHMPPPFELDFDKFDMLSEFPDLDHYNNTSGMIHHGASGPLLSSAMASNSQPQHQTATTQHSQQQGPVTPHSGQGQSQGPGGQNNPVTKHRHSIADYSPDWAWSDVSIITMKKFVILFFFFH